METSFHRAPAFGGQGACVTCGMELATPPIVSDEKRYCCRGCARKEAGRAQLYSPTSHVVECARAVHIDRDPDIVSDFLADIELLHLYEQKLSSIRVTAVSPDGKTACATADGQFMLLSYHIELHFDAFEAGGYKSTLCDHGPIAGLSGTFAVTPVDQGSVVTHTERYQFLAGRLGFQVGRMTQPYLGWSMAREVRTLKRLVEDPTFLGEALRAGDPRTLAVDPRVPVWDPRNGRPSRGIAVRVPSPKSIAIGLAFGLGAATALSFTSAKRR